MAVTYRCGKAYADEQTDLPAVLRDYSTANRYVAEHFADAVCANCQGRVFRLALHEAAGVAVRTCCGCGAEHGIGDSDEYRDEVEPEACECVCGKDQFEITVGVALYEGSGEVRRLYVGCRCPICGLADCYGHWRNDYPSYQSLLARV